jgi:hypothetical protein
MAFTAFVASRTPASLSTTPKYSSEYVRPAEIIRDGEQSGMHTIALLDLLVVNDFNRRSHTARVLDDLGHLWALLTNVETPRGPAAVSTSKVSHRTHLKKSTPASLMIVSHSGKALMR